MQRSSIFQLYTSLSHPDQISHTNLRLQSGSCLDFGADESTGNRHKQRTSSLPTQTCRIFQGQCLPFTTALGLQGHVSFHRILMSELFPHINATRLVILQTICSSMIRLFGELSHQICRFWRRFLDISTEIRRFFSMTEIDAGNVVNGHTSSDDYACTTCVHIDSLAAADRCPS